MAKLEKWQIDDLKSQVNIADYIGQDVVWDNKKSKPNDLWACCPFHGEKSPSFHVDIQKQRYHCFGCGASGDVIKYMTDYRNLSFGDAVKALGGSFEASGLSEGEKRQRRERQQREAKAREDKIAHSEKNRAIDARDIWSRGVPISGTLAERYLIGRGLPMQNWPVSLRFIESTRYDLERNRFLPALICGVQSVDRKIKAVWRIYLDAETGGKAKVENPKLGFGVSRGGAVRLGPSEDIIAVTEGVETAMGVKAITNDRWPVWAALSTSGMMGLEVPENVKKVLIYSDGDRYRYHKKTGEIQGPPGLYAAEQLHLKLAESGIESDIRIPPTGSDWLDVWNSMKAHV